MNDDQLKAILQHVQKPGQYLGNEVNSYHKDFKQTPIRVALIFPDAYEMGMSHNGLKILYEILNRMPNVVAERCFAPLHDMEEQLRKNNIPLFGLESKTPLKEFDIIGISLPYELTFTNAINILDLAQIPVWQKDRQAHHPLVLAGGTQSYNPEPMADFFDAIAIGDGEELIVDVINTVLEWKQHHSIDLISENTNAASKETLHSELSKITGIYIPHYFEPTYKIDGTLDNIKPLKPDYPHVKKRVVQDLNAQIYPAKQVVPNIKLIHDRIGIEIQRGCTRMCRFCQAGYIERPTRQRDPETVLKIADEALKNTGMQEISLLSLSAGDYQTIVPTMKELNRRYKNDKVSISVPATRTETLTPEMINEIKQVRMTGFTIAPEAGSARMRRVINKGNEVDDLLKACRNAFSAGYKLIKFYYMCGLPFERDEDVVNIANETYEALKIGREYRRDIKINVSVSSLVPKPFTPFQWEPQMTVEETHRKHQLIRQALPDRALNFKHHDAEMSFLEGIFARGDRRLSHAIYQAFKKGCRFDQWSEHFHYDTWLQTFKDCDVDVDFYTTRRRDKDEVLPWDHLFVQMQKSWLWNEYKKAAQEAFVADCSLEKCASFCGVCDFKTIKNKVYVIDEKPVAAKKGNREWYGRFGQIQDQPQAKNPHQEPLDFDSHFKLRVKFEKKDYASLSGHLELMEMIKRAIMRNRIPVAYSEGFHPQMKLAMGMALSLGVESSCEYFDLKLKQKVQIDDFIEKMNIALPQGLNLLEAEYIDLRSPSIYVETRSVDYQIQFPDTVSEQKLSELKENLVQFANGKEFTYTRLRAKSRKKPKTISINRYLKADTEWDDKKIKLTVFCDESGTLKPTEVLTALSSITESEMAGLRVRKVGIALAS